jgi:hypothetical protein
VPQAAAAIARAAYAYSLVGRRDEAMRKLGELEALDAAGSQIGPAQRALTYLAAGRNADALEWFNTAVETRDTPAGGMVIIAFIKENSFSHPTLEQPEFVEIRSRLGFVE